MNQEKTLPISFPPPITTFLHHIMPLSILCAQESTKNWFYNNYIQVFQPSAKECDHWVDFYPENQLCNFGTSFLKIHELNDLFMDLAPDSLLDFLTQKIDDGYYLEMILPERLIPGTQGFQTSRFLHQQFIYGYDGIKKTFKLLNFDRSLTLKTIEVPFDVIKDAFLSEDAAQMFEVGSRKQRYKYPISKFKLVLYHFLEFNPEHHPLDLRVISASLSNYLNSKNERFSLSPFFPIYHGQKWGISVFENLKNHVDQALSFKEVDYRAFHLLWEHKSVMEKRINHVENSIPIPTSILNEARELVKKSDELRMTLIKYSMRDLADSRMKKSVMDQLAEILQRDGEMLTSFMVACR